VTFVATNLRNRSEHFDFGQNWASYSKLIDDRRIEKAVENVRSLAGDLTGKSFLDIGCGSGLFSLAALKLGAFKVVAADIDENSVATTKKLLAEHDSAEVMEASVFDLTGEFDVVYSWGVLHHTGDMWAAIEAAAKRVAPGGIFAFSLYEKTPFCGAWRVEKRLYSKAPRSLQKLIRAAYLAVYGLGLLLTGKNPVRHLRGKQDRGMDPLHDAHDWLGGFPYESTTIDEVDPFVGRLGFTREIHRRATAHHLGLLGTGCSEYMYSKQPPPLTPLRAEPLRP
jgi:2-polyprenyl-6-hydroxyphenyl methylase/3-demethylubiquinone-9 3-methyltransferase